MKTHACRFFLMLLKYIRNATDNIMTTNMTKEELIKYIRNYDTFFIDAHLEHCPFHELMLIKVSIDIEKEKKTIVDYKPL